MKCYDCKLDLDNSRSDSMIIDLDGKEIIVCAYCYYMRECVRNTLDRYKQSFLKT